MKKIAIVTIAHISFATGAENGADIVKLLASATSLYSHWDKGRMAPSLRYPAKDDHPVSLELVKALDKKPEPEKEKGDAESKDNSETSEVPA